MDKIEIGCCSLCQCPPQKSCPCKEVCAKRGWCPCYKECNKKTITCDLKSDDVFNKYKLIM